MASAKASLDVDIESDFDIVHLDPSIDIHDHDLSQSQVIERLFELYEHCQTTARRLDRQIEIEIGTEEQDGQDQELDAFHDLLDKVTEFSNGCGFPRPLFVVAQTGTLVKETFNVGTFDDPFRQLDRLPAEIQVPKVVEMCRRYGVYLKEHNADYLSNEGLAWHPRLGIHAANIAPEFGVGQTRHTLRLCQEFGLHREAEEFLQLAYNSGKWEKWMLPNSRATDYDRAVIAGHYIYSTPEFTAIFERMRDGCAQHGVNLDASIRDALKLMMMRIMALFRLC
jgi:hypothetical protein